MSRSKKLTKFRDLNAEALTRRTGRGFHAKRNRVNDEVEEIRIKRINAGDLSAVYTDDELDDLDAEMREMQTLTEWEEEDWR